MSSMIFPFVIVIGLYLILMIVSIITLRIVFHRRKVPFYETGMDYSAENAIEYPREDIEFLSENKMLNGKLYGTANRKGVILLINGFNATTETHLAEIFYYVDNGWIVLTYDATGVGKSEGRSVNGLEQTRIDALAAMNYLESESRFSGLPVLLYGHSVGGYAAATLCDDDRVCAVLCVSGFESPCALMKYHAKKHIGIMADICEPFIKLYDKVMFGKQGDLSASEHVMNSKKPVLIVHGSEDEIIPMDLSLYHTLIDDHSDNIELRLIDEEYRNRHSTIWLTKDAAKEYHQIVDHMNEFRKEGLNHYSKEKAEEFSAMTNKILRKIDTGFLSDVHEFYSQAVMGR